jgi:hypothetical protein
MPFARTVCLILLLSGFVGLHAQGPAVSPCKGSTVDTYDASVAAGSRAFVVALQKLVRAGDKEGIAALVGYPVNANRTVHGKLTHSMIRNQAQFVAAYDSLFSENVKTAILNPDAVRCLFANDQGFMIGDGQVWFEQTASKSFRISALNP